MGLLPVRYLYQEHLAGFDQYKYCSIDDSPLSTYVTHPFWEKCVKVRFDVRLDARKTGYLAINLASFSVCLLVKWDGRTGIAG